MDLGTTAIRYRAFYAIVVILLPYLTGKWFIYNIFVFVIYIYRHVIDYFC